MGRSWRIATISGIPILLHWTLGLFVMSFIWFAYQGSFDLIETTYFLGFIVCLFICIILHEFGHALTAKRYGVITKDIILSPIGGLARLESIPENPIQELKIAINGPLVNLAIAGILAIVITALGLGFAPQEIAQGYFLQWLFYMNIGVFVFNLIPAFPMDGGRILRSILSIRIGRERATFWASLIGKILAVLFVVFAIYSGNLILAIIGAFIFIMAEQEYKQVKLSEVMKETPLQEIMISNYSRIQNTTKSLSFLKFLESTEERDFLVYDDEGKICGSLPSMFVDEIRKNPKQYEQIKDIASLKHNSLREEQSVDEAFRLMKDEGLAIIGIKKDGQTIGVVDRPIISSFIIANQKRGFGSRVLALILPNQ